MAFMSSVKIPPFIMSDPRLWFAMCESIFALGVPITDSNLKFSHIVLNLPQDAAAMVRDLIIYPDETDPYTAIKTELIQRINPSILPHQAFSAAQKSSRPANLQTATPPLLDSTTSLQYTQASMSHQYRNLLPSQHLTPTPTEVSVPSPLTPEIMVQSSTPQSQGSSRSPSAIHLTNPSQGHSPEISNAPSILQQLEQTALPQVTTDPSSTPAASSAVQCPSAIMTHYTDIGLNYYGHSNAEFPQQDQMHISPGSDDSPQLQSTAFPHVSQQNPHLNQPDSVGQLPSSIVSRVLNSQPIQRDISEVSTLSTSSLVPEESIPVKSSQHSLVSYVSDNSSTIPWNIGSNHYPASKTAEMKTFFLQEQTGLTPDPPGKTFSDNPPKPKPPKPPKRKQNKTISGTTSGRYVRALKTLVHFIK